MDFVKGIKWCLAATALAAVAACGGGGGGTSGASGTPAPGNVAGVVAPPAADPQVRASIGAAGGEVGFADQRFKLAIPAGALGNTTEIVITEVSPDNLSADLKAVGADKVYRLEPNGLQFALPVTATAQLPAGNAVAVLLHDADGRDEYPAEQQVTLAKGGRTVSGQITHFSSVLVDSIENLTATLRVTPQSLQVGETVTADVTIEKADTGRGAVIASSDFSTFNVDVEARELPPKPTQFGFDRAETVSARLSGRCQSEGRGSIAFAAQLPTVRRADATSFFDDIPVRLVVNDDFDCKPGQVTLVTASEGVITLPVASPDDIRVVPGPIANFPGKGPFVTVAGANGAMVVDLATRQTVADFTSTGPERDVLGSPVIGVLPITRPGQNAPAALFAFGNNGFALRNFVPSLPGFGAVGIGFDTVFDAVTVGGSAVADAFISASPRAGVEFYAFDTTEQAFRGGVSQSIHPSLFPGGQLVSAARATTDGAVIALTRGHDGNTTSRLWSHPGTGTDAATPLATLPAEARRVRCTNLRANAQFCAATLASGSASLFVFDTTRPAATLTPLTVPTGRGSLGVDVGVRANGNAYAVVANFDANSLNVIEVTPDLGLVGNTSVAAPAGVTKTAHVALFTDGDGVKAAVTGNGSGNVWVQRVLQ